MSDCLTEEPRIESHLSPYEAVEVMSCVDAAIAQKPSLYYGWIMLPLAMAALVASSPGQTFGVSILNEPMRESLQLTHGQLAAAYTFGTMLGALPITFVGTLMDRYGMRRTMLAAVSFFALACGLTAIVQGWAMLVIAFFTLRSLGPGTLAFLSGNTLAFWFDRRLGMVEGLRQLGMAVAMAFVPTLNLWLVAHFGWRGAYAWLGTGVWLTLFPLLWLFFRDRPEHVGQEIDGGTRVGRAASVGASDGHLWGSTLGEALRTPTFWIVAFGTALYGAIHTGIFFCLVPIFQEHSLSAADAATTLTLYAACYAAMQFVGGTLADRMRAPLLLFLGLIGLAVSMVLLDATSTPWAAKVFGASLGASQGIYFGVAHPLWARYFGRRHLGKIRGVVMTLIVGLSSVGPLFAGVTRDMTGDFRFSLWAFAIAPIPLAIASLFITRPPQTASAPAEIIASSPESVGEFWLG